MQVEIVLSYGGVKVSGVEEFADDPFSPPLEHADFLWREGNYSCDCIRSLWMRARGVPIPELPCGNTIQLMSLMPFTLH